MKNVSGKRCAKIKAHILPSMAIFYKIMALWDNLEKTLWSRESHRWQYGSRALYAGNLRLQIQSQCIILLFFHCNNGCTKPPQFYILRAFFLLLYFKNLNYGHCVPIWSHVWKKFGLRCKLYILFASVSVFYRQMKLLKETESDFEQFSFVDAFSKEQRPGRSQNHDQSHFENGCHLLIWIHPTNLCRWKYK